MIVKSKVNAENALLLYLKKIKPVLLFNPFSLFLAAIALSFSIAYVLAVWSFAPDKLRAPLASWAHRQGYFSAINDGGILKTLLLAPLKTINRGEGHEIPQIHIDIKFKHLQKIRKKRAVALENGYLDSNREDYVPASIRYEDKTVPVKLRLKGDLIDHFQSNKWSFRIHVKNDEYLFGLRRFSLQAPWTRGFHSEILFFETLRHIGLLAPRYFFLDVVINGDSVGIMALEEHFSKELLEHNKRREGVITKFDESLFWNNNQGPVFYNFRNVPIEVFGSSRVKKSPKLSSNYAVAVGLLRGFVDKQLLASNVFDVEQMGRFLAVAELWGASHTIEFTNQRFYLNPITFKLEPIAFDASIPSRDIQLPALSGDALMVKDHSLAREILKDPAIFEVYLKTLKHLSDEIVNGKLLGKLKEVENRILPALSQEFPLLTALPWEDLRQRAIILRELSAADYNAKKKSPDSYIKSYSNILHAYLESDENGPYVEVANAIPEPIEINSLEWFSKTGGEKKSFTPTSRMKFPFTLPATPINALPKAVRIYYPLYDLEKYSLRIYATIVNRREPYEFEVKTYFPPFKIHPIPTSSVLQQLQQHPFLVHKPAEKELQVKPGIWDVDELLIVPNEYSLIMYGNTTLRFSKDSGLISRGSLRFMGTRDAPIFMKGQNGRLWQGIAVLMSHEPSQWSFVNILNTTGIHHGRWQLTGGTTFYQSEIQLEHCLFVGNQGEDALNIVESKFNLKSIGIENAGSDGLDADFSEGIIEGGLFRNIGKLGGGDGVDISGSKISINGTVFQDISDKALSIGERSTATATNITINNVATGAASKDGSILTISESNIKNTKFVGLIAYVKKAEYGSASIEARNMKFADVGNHARVQKGSFLTLEGNPIIAEDIDVEQLYKTIMKPGLKK